MVITLGFGQGARADVDFQREIRPILSQNCFQCHGPDEKKRQGGLRLDLSREAFSEGESGKLPIVAGKPQDSELIVRILTEDQQIRMPPGDSGFALSSTQKELLQQWIREGAQYQQHWAFTTPTRPAVPKVNKLAWTKNSLDNFVLEKLEHAGLAPSPLADKHTLIRRASLDLLGLPPSIDDVESFLADQSPDAYEKLLDRLLMSRHYGERMALPWLDYARFADSNGYQSDSSREMWVWRDWVIQAFNQNMPFDQFTVEQLAGDLLPNSTREQLIATGFNRNHRLNGEGGRIEAEWFVETVIDRIETTGLTWLGLTLNCCRCHDHKYDPISQKEFYQLFAFFNSVDESGVLAPVGKKGENTPPLLTITSEAEETQLKKLASVVDLAKRDHQQAVALLDEHVATWEKTASLGNQPLITWERIEPTQVKSNKGAIIAKLADNSHLVSGPNPANDSYELTIPLNQKRMTGLLLEVFPDDSLPNKSLGRGSNGNFVLTEIQAQIESSTLENAKRLRFTRAEADYEQSGWPAKSVIGDRRRTRQNEETLGWAIDGNDPAKRVARRLLLVFEPLDVPSSASLHITMRHDSQFADHNVGRFRWSLTTVEPDAIKLNVPAATAEIAAILKLPASQRLAEHRQQLEKYFLDNVPNPVRQAEDRVKAAELAISQYRDSLTTTMIMKEREPRDAFILTRGQYDRPSEKVPRGLPAVLPPLPAGEPLDRLGLARWIVHRSNPLTARVWINRQWERLFGIGLVRTTENLGSQAEFPSHPELLDWLACEFMEPTELPTVAGVPARPWDMKAIQKFIMLSATYQQTSAATATLLQQDPENRLLARGPRFRITGELVRDQALAVAGLLVPQIGGPSVRPYMPQGVWDETSKYGNLRNYQADKGDGLYRRTMYTIWKRTAAPPSMLLFDAPNRETCTIKRSRTNTPLQSLSLLNEMTFVEAARNLGGRMLNEGGPSIRSQLERGFRIALARSPTDKEIQVLLDGYEEDYKHFAADPQAATKLLSFGNTQGATSDVAQLAALTLAANVLMNLDEFVTRE